MTPLVRDFFLLLPGRRALIDPLGFPPPPFTPPFLINTSSLAFVNPGPAPHAPEHELIMASSANSFF